MLANGYIKNDTESSKTNLLIPSGHTWVNEALGRSIGPKRSTMPAVTNMSMRPTTNSTSPLNYSSVDEEPLQGTEVSCEEFLFVVYVVVFGTMCIFGLIGNTLSFLVLQWEKHSHVATFLLQVMALADNLFLVCTGFVQIYAATTIYYDVDEPALSAYIPLVAWPLVHITQLGTVWITVLIAFNRYIAICRPFQAPKLCTMGRVRIQVAIMVLFCILYNIPRFLEYRVTHETTNNVTIPIPEPTDMLKSSYYKYIYENGLYCIFVFLAPLIILIVLNVCLMRELWRARQRLLQRQLPATMTGEDQENNLTLVMIVIILIFVICQTPALINNLLYATIPDQNSCGKPYFYYFHLSNILISANSSVNFVVYCVFRKQFRERLKAFCQRNHNFLKHTDTYSYDGRTACTTYSKNSSPTRV